MDYRIIWTLRARDDLKETVKFIARDNPAAALKLGDEIFKRVDDLERFPLMGRMVPERKQNELRELIFKNYRVVYRVEEMKQQIEVLRVWHAARGEPDLVS